MTVNFIAEDENNKKHTGETICHAHFGSYFAGFADRGHQIIDERKWMIYEEQNHRRNVKNDSGNIFVLIIPMDEKIDVGKYKLLLEDTKQYNPGCAFIIQGSYLCKQSEEEDQKVRQADVEKLAKEYDCPCIFTNAITGKGIQKLKDEVTKQDSILKADVKLYKEKKLKPLNTQKQINTQKQTRRSSWLSRLASFFKNLFSFSKSSTQAKPSAQYTPNNGAIAGTNVFSALARTEKGAPGPRAGLDDRELRDSLETKNTDVSAAKAKSLEKRISVKNATQSSEDEYSPSSPGFST
jgi:hypothetical protein